MQEAEAFALYHKALDLQKHDKLEESARAYHELLKTPLLKEVTHTVYLYVGRGLFYFFILISLKPLFHQGS